MPKDFPDFESDDELVEWFESTDLSEYQLDEVLAWTVAKQVILTNEEPWVAKHSSGSVGATATIELDDSLLSPA